MAIEFERPGPDAPGYLRRQRAALALQQGDMTPEQFDGLVENLLADYVIEPPDRAAAIEALWNMSEADYGRLLDMLGGGEGEVPPKS